MILDRSGESKVMRSKLQRSVLIMDIFLGLVSDSLVPSIQGALEEVINHLSPFIGKEITFPYYVEIFKVFRYFQGIVRIVMA